MYVPKIMMKISWEKRKSSCNENRVQFFGPPGMAEPSVTFHDRCI